MKKFLLALFLFFAALYNNLYAATLLAEYHFEDPTIWNGTAGEVKDSSGNNLNGKTIGSLLPYPGVSSPAKSGTPGTCGYATMPGPWTNGGAFEFANLPVNTSPGAKTTVAFWMYWDGTNGVMPIGWNIHDLWLDGGYFGFNTGNGDLFGTTWAGLANGWHYVVAIFTNGNVAANELYIDGAKKVLEQKRSSPVNTRAYVDSTLRIGGWQITNGYRFSGKIDEVYVYDGALTPSEVSTLYNQTHTCQAPVPTPATLLAEYHFEDPTIWNGTAGEVKDSSGNNRHGKAIGSPLPSPDAVLPAKSGTPGTCGYAEMPGPYTGGAFEFANLPVNTSPGAKTTVAFWMYWDGTNGVMPIGWNIHDLWLDGGYFGFNTGNGDLFGTTWAGLANGWHHVVAIFTNGNVAANELYIDGAKKVLGQIYSSPINTRVYVDSTLRVSGWQADNSRRFSGKIDEVYVYDGALTPSEVSTLYNQTHTCQAPTSDVNFDAWETTGGVNARNIYTKVASNPFTLSVAQLNSDGNALMTPTKAEDVNVSVVDTDTNQLYDKQSLHFDASGSNPKSVTFNIPRAIKNAKIRITASGKDYNSTDSFAIKPSDFTLTPSVTTIKAGEPFDLSAANPTSGYNGTAVISTATYNQSCSTKSGFLTTEPVSLNFASTPQSATGLIMKDVGDINVSIKDSTWTAVDQPNDCIVGSNSNIVNANGKVGCNIDTNATIKVVPYDINASKTSKDPMWAYRSVNGVPKFNFSFDTNATRPPIAQLSETMPQPTINFSGNCFAEESTVVIDMSITPNTKSLTSVNDVNVTSSDSGVTIVSDNDKLTVKLPASLFNSGKANVTLQINSDKNISTPEDVVKLTATGWTSSIAEKNYDKLSTSDNIYFLYGKISAPNAVVDYSSTATVRAYAEVYTTDSSKFPGGASGWVQAPGSSKWWINKLDTSGATPMEIINVLPRASIVLKDDNTTDTYAGIKTSLLSNIFGGIGQVKLDMAGAINKDQQIKLHFNVPSYLWYGSKPYSFVTNTDCSQHPCMSVDIFGTTSDTNWYGDGDKKGNKAIKTVPKGKRTPKVNW